MEELSGHLDGGISPLPINSYSGGNGNGHGHMVNLHHHHHHHQADQIPSSGPPILADQDHVQQPYGKKVVIRYRECLKNHAAAMGGSATDGCGEFMPSGEEGTLEALNCSACNCHRNFHRKEIEAEGEPQPSSCAGFNHPPRSASGLRKVILGHHHHHHHHKSVLGGPGPTEYSLGHPTALPGAAAAAASLSAPAAHSQMIMAYNYGISESDQEQQEFDGDGVMRPALAHHHQLVKKRFRTKFTQEQKEKMLSFAEKIGWKLQKQEESVVQQFCQEIGVRRRVLKVWMHNNKHNLAKKNSPLPEQSN